MPNTLSRLLAVVFLLAMLALNGRAAAVISGGEYASAEEEAAIEAADEIYESRDFESAWVATRAVVENYPDSLEALRLLCVVAQASDRLGSLMAEYKPDQLPAERRLYGHYVWAWSSLLMGDLETAKIEAAKAKALSDRPRFELERIVLVVKRNSGDGEPEEIAAAFGEFITKYRQIDAAWASYLNLFNFQQEGSDKHKQAIEDAIATAPSPEAYQAAMQLEERDLWADPARNLERVTEALEKFPQSTAMAARLIKTLRQLGRTEEALAVATEWSDRLPFHGELLSERINLLADQNRFDEAVTQLHKLAALKHQKVYQGGIALREARLLHLANRREEAIACLAEMMEKTPDDTYATAAAMMRSRLTSAPPDAKVVLLPPIGYLQQRGNYCGPATMHVMLRHRGIEKTQEEIAAKVYTGIAGTPPQVLAHYAETLGLKSIQFKGDDDTWRRLIDAGYPVLWLHMLGQRGAHYRVITGYDEVLKHWWLQDPNDYERRAYLYIHTRDAWPIPDMRRSIVFFPPEMANDPVLQDLHAPPLMRITDWIMYVATGSNLFVSFLPALPINLLFAWLLAQVILILLRTQTFPLTGLRTRTFALAVVGLVLPVNLLIAAFRWGDAVSLLLAFHLGLISLIPLLAATAVLRTLTGDYFHPRESTGFCALVVFTWIFISFFDQDWLQWGVPVVMLLVILPIILWPRLRMRRAEWLARRGRISEALAILRPYASAADFPWFDALAFERGLLLQRGDLPGWRVAIDKALTKKLPAGNAQLVRFEALLGRWLADPASLPEDEVARLATERRLPKRVRIMTEGLLQLVRWRRSRELKPLESDENALLEKLGRLVGKHRFRDKSCEALFLSAVREAIHRAHVLGHSEREAALRERWLERLGMYRQLEMVP